MKERQLAEFLGPVVAGCGLELEVVEVIPAGKRRILRIVVDGDGSTGRGPDLDEIAEATRRISVALDESDATGAAPYTLEVSSRGVSRPLTAPRHWRRNRGRLVAVTLAGGASLTGRIAAPDEASVLIDVDGATRELAYAQIARAIVQIEFNATLEDGENDSEQDDSEQDDGDTATGELDGEG